jgi:hypothetical protein
MIAKIVLDPGQCFLEMPTGGAELRLMDFTLCGFERFDCPPKLIAAIGEEVGISLIHKHKPKIGRQQVRAKSQFHESDQALGRHLQTSD